MAEKVIDVTRGGQPVCSDKDAAACLAQGHSKSGAAPTAWGMKDQQNDHDGNDDDARSQSFNKG